MDAHTFSGSRSGVLLAAIIDELPEETRQNVRRRVSSRLCEVRALTKLLVRFPDKRAGQYLIRLTKNDHLDAVVASSLPPKIKTFLCNVLTTIFREVARELRCSTETDEEYVDD